MHNPFNEFAESARRQADNGGSYSTSAGWRMFWMSASFIGVPFCGITALALNATGATPPGLVIVFAYTLCASLAFFAMGAWNKTTRQMKPDDLLIDEGITICNMIRHDRTMNREWRRRADSLRGALKNIQERRARYASLPSVDRSKLNGTVNALHDAAVSLAHYQMMAGISEHAEIAAREVDLVLRAYESLPA